MVLSVHTLVGGAVGVALKTNPIISFFTGMASHFVLDAIPHSDYPLRSLDKAQSAIQSNGLKKDGSLAHDLVVNGLDGIIGFLVLIFLTYSTPYFWGVLASAIGACVPDGLQFISFLFPKVKILNDFRTFHDRIHIKEKIKTYMAVRPLLSFCIQAFIFLLSIYSILHLTK